jgi:Secretion system C-terminal sorting domain/Beta-propeller repeat
MKNKFAPSNYRYELLTAIVFSISFTNLIFAQAPTFKWAKSFGNTGADFSHEVITDAVGNHYLTGEFEGTVDFDPGAGVSNLIATGLHDVFVCKYDISGNLVWARQMGGSNDDVAYSVCVDVSGNVFLTGTFYGTVDFDPGASAVNLTSNGFTDIFVVKLNSSGNYAWAKSVGGLYMDAGLCIRTDNLGNCYITGTYDDVVDFDPGVGTTTLSTVGSSDAYVWKLDALGNFSWIKNFVGSSQKGGFWLGLDNSGNVIVTGSYASTVDFDPGQGTYTLTSVGGIQTDVYIVKLSSSGNFVWARSMGGIGFEIPRAMAIDKLGNIYTAGQFNSSTADFDPGVGTANLSLSTPTAPDIFVSKLDASGNYLWAKKIGGLSPKEAYGIAIDTTMACYITGVYQGTADFDPGIGTYNLTSAGGSDIFIEKLDIIGNFVWAKALGGTLTDVGRSITVDLSGNIYTTGQYIGTFNFNTDAGVLNLTSAVSSADIFVHKMGQSSVGIGEYEWWNSIIMYPNPASNYFNIESTSTICSITIIDVNGRTVYTQPVNTNKVSVNITTLSNGVYFIKAEGKNAVLSMEHLVINK